MVTEHNGAGAMVAEEQRLLTTAGEEVVFERTRTLNEAGAILTDRRLGPEGVMELRFTYDEDGRLLARRALRDGALTAVHDWEYGACGVTRHGIARTEIEEVDGDFGVGEVHPLPGLPVDLPSHESFERRYFEGCLVTESLRVGTLLEAVRRDDLGQVIERWGALSREAYRYDPDTGLRVFEGTDWDGDERFDTSWDHELNEENLLVRRDWRFASSSLSERYTYRRGG